MANRQLSKETRPTDVWPTDFLFNNLMEQTSIVQMFFDQKLLNQVTKQMSLIQNVF
jgi:hypothetical protein